MLDENTLAAYAELSHLELARDGQRQYGAIREEVRLALHEAGIPSDELITMYDKLAVYSLCASVQDIIEGRYVRWLELGKLAEGLCVLAKGGLCCGFSECKSGPGLLLRNFRGGLYTRPLCDILVFQQMSDDELLVSKALDYLAQSHEGS
jgi:hypothetical protein